MSEPGGNIDSIFRDVIRPPSAKKTYRPRLGEAPKWGDEASGGGSPPAVGMDVEIVDISGGAAVVVDRGEIVKITKEGMPIIRTDDGRKVEGKDVTWRRMS